MKRKKVLRPHIILLTEGRLFTLIMIVGVIAIVSAALYLTFSNGAVWSLILAIAVPVAQIYTLNFLWEQVWGKLILKEDRIVWRCLFRRKIEIKYTDIKRVASRDFGSRNVIKVDLYKTGFQWFLISTDCTLPSKPIDKIKCKKGLIKWRNSDKACQAMREFFPDKFKYNLQPPHIRRK
jgi:hypothetical protein